MRIGLFVTCLTDTLFPDTGRAVVAVLERLGHQVDFPAGQACCGQMHFNTGYRREAVPMARGFAAAFPKSVGTNRREMSGLRFLIFHQPTKRLQTCLEYVASRSPMATQDHRMRKLCIVVCGDRLEPLPFLRAVSLKQLEQSRGKQVTQLIHQPVAGKAAEIFLHREQDEGPGARRSELLYDRQASLEEERAKIAMTVVS